jgi:hypothetical protein
MICAVPFCLLAQDLRIIDFEHIKSQVHKSQNNKSWFFGLEAFNHSPELIPFFTLLQKEYSIPIAIETGTDQGNTTVFLARTFNKVYTVELFEAQYNSVKDKLAPFPNVQCYLGDFAHMLNDVLPHLQGQRVFFYLDAHGQSDWPLLSELDAISTTHKDNCIVVIDDFKVPGRADIPYDSYNNIDCSYEYVRERLSKIFTEYECCIVIPKVKNGRAKFVAFPKKWGTHALVKTGFFKK